MTDAVPDAIPAATVVPIRDGADGLEVLMVLRRRQLADFGGSWVFPGGRLDPADLGGDDEGSARRAAVREAAEEAGLSLSAADLVAWSHWTPPPGAGRRFATWFFLAPVDPGATITVDGGEVHDHRWIRPADALAERDAGTLQLAPPTVVTLSQLGAVAAVADVLGPTASPRPVERFASRLLTGAEHPVLVWHGDVAAADGDLTRSGPRHRLEMGDRWLYVRSLASDPTGSQAVEVTAASDPVRGLTAFDPASVHPADGLAVVAARMTETNCAALLVRGKDDELGVLTERDVVHGLSAGDADAWATDVMTRDVIVVDAETTVADAARQMIRAGIRHLVVRDGDRVGILSLRDCVAPLLAAIDHTAA